MRFSTDFRRQYGEGSTEFGITVSVRYRPNSIVGRYIIVSIYLFLWRLDIILSTTHHNTTLTEDMG